VLFDTGASKEDRRQPSARGPWTSSSRRGSPSTRARPTSWSSLTTHGHLDHVEGDAQFAGRPATTVVDRELEAVREFFGFTAAGPRSSNSTSAAVACCSSPAPLATSPRQSRLRPLERFPDHRRQRIARPDLRIRLPRYLDSMERTCGISPRTREITHRDGLATARLPVRPGRATPSAAATTRQRPLQMTVQQLMRSPRRGHDRSRC
jgi:hypothetical protein